VPFEPGLIGKIMGRSLTKGMFLKKVRINNLHKRKRFRQKKKKGIECFLKKKEIDSLTSSEKSQVGG
jgi:hypothetical protein